MRRDDRGAALLLVLAAVALLSALAVELASRAGVESLRAARSSRDASFRRIFDSGAEIAGGLLAESVPAEATYWGQAWNRQEKFVLATDLEGTVRVSDESGKLNIARAITHPAEAPAIRASVQRLFKYLSGRGNSLNLKEIEEKTLRRLSTREPLVSLDGLREVGVEPLTIFAPDGLSRYLTCFGDGKINLNTAPKPVLAALDPEFDEAMVERISGYRGKREGMPGAYKPFKAPEDLMLVEGIVTRSVGNEGRLLVVRNLYEKVRGLVSVRNSCFSARIEARVGSHHREAWAFFKVDGARIAFEEILP